MHYYSDSLLETNCRLLKRPVPRTHPRPEEKRRDLEGKIPLPNRSAYQVVQQLLGLDASPSEPMSRREMFNQLRRALAMLPEDDRIIILVRNFKPLTFAEVACLLSTTPYSAQKRYENALVRLRNLMMDRGVLKQRPTE
jgi:DNA-directed RNA polymerase specialized sigma24 family protein